MANLSVWLTPLWLLALGATIGALILLVAWAVVWAVNRPLGRAILSAVQESILLPISYALVALAVLAVAASPIMPVERMWSSIIRLPHVGPVSFEKTVPPETVDFEVPLSVRVDELQSYTIESDEDVAVNVEPGKGFVAPLLQVEGGQLYGWKPGSRTERAFEADVQTLYLTNESSLSTVVKVTLQTDVEMPEVHDLPVTAASVVALFLGYLLIRWQAPKVSVIATATAKEAVSQPLYFLLLAVGVFALVAYVFIPYNTFGEDVKMLKTSGMVTIKILAITIALWTASVSISEEIEGRTALTVLSKPVSRRQFILGKFLGIVWPIVLIFVILGLVFLLTVSLKVVYDAREASKLTPDWQACYVEVVRIVPGLVLAFYEAIVFAAISVAISTRLSMLPNLVICGSIYVMGHLGPLIVNSAAGKIVFIKFIGQFISVLFPVLDHYEIEGAIAGSSIVPPEYLLTALLYSFLYCAVAMLLALFFFEDRDLA
ncbi:MAG: ABC transporter permease subunit [Planctomycetes bacterium]|nr:ABC transporter permease subunit [Planctomycetota bacterium]